MLTKPKAMPADPTKVCRTCSHHDPDLQVCCANDVVVSLDDAEIKSCGDWEPKKICITCDHFDPDTNQCCSEEQDMSEEDSLTRTCDSWEREQDHGTTLRVADPEEDKKQREAQVQECLIAKEKGYRRGYMVAELHMMCDAASQLLPDRKPQWERLRSTLEDALRALWARNDQDKEAHP